VRVAVVSSLKWLHEVLLTVVMEQHTVTNSAAVCHDKTLNQQHSGLTFQISKCGYKLNKQLYGQN